MPSKPIEMTRQPDLAHERRTGPFRTQRPVYVDLLPPCNHACPAGENIQAWLAEAQAGRFEEAWRILVADNPMPAVHGRVCYHPCESACNRKDLDNAVSIHAVERFLGDCAIEHGWRFQRAHDPSGKRVLVVGAGPSGLSAGYHLARLGHEVEIRDAGPIAGGMMHFGIPAYRMPRDMLEAEIRKIEDLGVRITLDHKVEDVEAEMKGGRFDACFIAVGAHLSKRTEIPARDAGKMLDAVSFLRDSESHEAPQLGRVAVYGGGNTAMDAARVARRLGASEAMIIYRRDRAHMPAHEFEADEAEAEGVKIHWLRTIKSIDRTTFTVEVMEIDEHGRPQPTGRLETLEAELADHGAGPGHRHRVPQAGRGRHVREGRHGRGRRQHDDRPSRAVRRGRYGAERAHRDGRGRPRQESGPAHRRLPARRQRTSARRSTTWRTSTSCTCGTTPTPPSESSGRSTSPSAPVRSTRSSPG